MDRQCRGPKFEIQDVGPEQGADADFHATLAEAPEREGNRGAQILAERDMLSAAVQYSA